MGTLRNWSQQEEDPSHFPKLDIWASKHFFPLGNSGFFFCCSFPNTHRVKSQTKRAPNKFTICQWSYWCNQLSSGALEGVIQNLGFLPLYPVVCMLWKTNQKHLFDSSKYYSSKHLMYRSRNNNYMDPSNAISLEFLPWDEENKLIQGDPMPEGK